MRGVGGFGKTALLAVIGVAVALATPHAQAADAQAADAKAADAQAADANAPAYHGDGGTVRLLYSPSGTSTYPPFVIQKFGLDKKYGVKLELVPFTSMQAAVTAIRDDGADIGLVQWPDIIRIRNTGLAVVGVAPFLRWGADFVLEPADSPIKTLADLRGKTFGEFGRASLNSIIVHAAAKKLYGLDLNKDATIQESSMPLLIGQMEQGKIDATDAFNTLEPDLVLSGKARVLVKISDLIHQIGFTDTPYLIYAAAPHFAEAHANNLRAFLAAYRESIQILKTNDEVWLEQGRNLKMSDQAAAMFGKDARTDIEASFTPDTEANIRKVFALIVDTAGAQVLGFSEVPPGFLNLEYQ